MTHTDDTGSSSRTDEGRFDVDSLIQRLVESKGQSSRMVPMTETEITDCVLLARDVFLSQDMMLELECPLKICGDIHGQYTDLLRLFAYGSYPPVTNYLFLGDYVDRGKQSIETIVLLLCYKIKYRENFFLLRGNHECAAINRVYGFYDECRRRFSVKLWKTFQDCFNCMPVCALVEEKIFCMHGGISPYLSRKPGDWEDIRNCPRPTEIPESGILCDLLWADPDNNISGYKPNSRGVSFIFGPDAVEEFCREKNLDLICRAHQVVEEGYEFFGNRKLITLFSAPNYCGEFDNAGATMYIDENMVCSFQLLKPSPKLRTSSILTSLSLS